ncbi:MAG: ABC transporter substrate-binding protein [Rhodoferax sp.]
MKFLSKIWPVAVTAIAMATFAAPAMATDLKVGFISSLSGPIAALGIPYEKGIRVAASMYTTIAGQKVQLIVMDDASDPSTAARNARKLVNEDKVDVLIGTSGVPGAMAIAAVARETRTPLISPTPVALPGEEGLWTVTVSQPFPLMVSAVVERMKRSGVKTVAFIGFSDASVVGQILKIVAARPDAVFAGNSGTPGALPYLALTERGYRGGLYGTHGLINPDFVRVGGAAVEGLSVPSGPVMVADQLSADNPIRRVATGFRAAYQRQYQALPSDAFAAYTFDAWLLFADAVARVKGKSEPGTPQFRAALYEALTQTRELAGTHGIYNFKPGERYGLDERSRVIIKLEKGQWKLAP